ncbi:winged helix-turn-helix transcriptional regulator [Streptomyces sp. SID9913]|uniref:Transcriptional regulator n=3 Tax=Streptomyces TaxID=1883 RepID=F3NQD0_9ACTN|nr:MULTISPECIES: metalloregulator ArsR/SmtB family transcription factor [Streptomyces]MCP8712354.1 winged helix-turn-helix transcriptional regulator [Streptomyces sp. AC04842]AVV45433.1 ArsR family transcriptional regulator [Streptomyces sp. P3]EGG44390.1 transcriptional regulator [Streptomyces griseoaurantiacus M045]NEA84924.1 winged helix-turn-helix transcriptional regulator [Streptomyces sp. SID14436]NEC78137.1 winged helix-turn-helix transcriptional regulator [Streptomyces sp. SID7958]
MGSAPVLVRTEAAASARQADAGCSHTDTVARFFRALADPTRLKLLEFILRGERTCAECVGYAGVSQSRVSVHLACLTACGYVTGHRDGRRLRYRVGDPRVADLVVLARAVAADHDGVPDRCSGDRAQPGPTLGRNRHADL